MEKKQKNKMGTDMKIFIVVSMIIALGLIILISIIGKPNDVAVVDKNKVTAEEFQYYLSQNISQALQSKDPSMDNETYLNSSYGTGTIKDAIKQQTLSQVVQIEILLLGAKKDGFKVSSGELNQEWQTFLSSLNQNAEQSMMTPEDFSKGTLGLSLNKIEKIYKDYVISQKYFEAKVEEVKVDEKALSAFYEENKSSIDRAVVRHILVAFPEGAEDAVVTEKKKLAEDILEKVNKGEDFSALAKEYSEDPGSKDNGGVYEIQPNGQMVAEFENWAFSHQAGDTGVIRTTFGFHIMSLDSIFNTLESQKEEIERAYKYNEYNKMLDESIKGTQYKIEIKEGYKGF